MDLKAYHELELEMKEIGNDNRREGNLFNRYDDGHKCHEFIKPREE